MINKRNCQNDIPFTRMSKQFIRNDECSDYCRYFDLMITSNGLSDNRVKLSQGVSSKPTFGFRLN